MSSRLPDPIALPFGGVVYVLERGPRREPSRGRKKFCHVTNRQPGDLSGCQYIWAKDGSTSEPSQRLDSAIGA